MSLEINNEMCQLMIKKDAILAPAIEKVTAWRHNIKMSCSILFDELFAFGKADFKQL